MRSSGAVPLPDASSGQSWRNSALQLAERPASLGGVARLLDQLARSDVGDERAAARAGGTAAAAREPRARRKRRCGSSGQPRRSRSGRTTSSGWRRGQRRSRTRISGCRDRPAPTLAALVAWCAQASAALDGRADAPNCAQPSIESRALAEELIDRAMRLAELADDFVEETEFGFLFDRERQLFSIGFSVTDGRLDRRTTTRWRPRRAWRALSRSRRDRSLTSTGSSWDAH